MAKTCSSCNYYDDEGNTDTCPECGALLQFTMLPPSGYQEDAPSTVESTQPAWENVSAADIEILEQPLAIRLTQICSGIGFYFLVWRWGGSLLRLCFADLLYFHDDPMVSIVTAAVISIVLYMVAALVAGAIAGAWTVNWIPQGVGVGVGLLILPLILLLFISPESLTFYMIVVFITTCVTVVGAYIGHILVKPSRVIHS